MVRDQIALEPQNITNLGRVLQLVGAKKKNYEETRAIIKLWGRKKVEEKCCFYRIGTVSVYNFLKFKKKRIEWFNKKSFLGHFLTKIWLLN